MIISPGKDSKIADFPILFSHIDEDDPRFEGYMELKSLMSIPVIEQIILSKLEELKLIAKEKINYKKRLIKQLRNRYGAMARKMLCGRG